jgi:hypothetical protein
LLTGVLHPVAAALTRALRGQAGTTGGDLWGLRQPNGASATEPWRGAAGRESAHTLSLCGRCYQTLLAVRVLESPLMAVPLTAADTRLLAQGVPASTPAATPKEQLCARSFAALRQQLDAQRAALDDWDGEEWENDED